MAVFILDVPILFEIETEWAEETFSGFIDCEAIQRAVGLSLYQSSTVPHPGEKQAVNSKQSIKSVHVQCMLACMCAHPEQTKRTDFIICNISCCVSGWYDY